ncbi:MAG TPA: hypothetical protein VFQ54_02005, partial [Thermomicrobiales bacterium]|nr:hypothetical protein [Thermomicrobiales bacterium]
MSSKMDESRDGTFDTEENHPSATLNRRKLIGTGAALSAGLAVSALAARAAGAQDAATPAAATPESQTEASGAQFPVATSLGDAIPPEFTGDPTNWPAESFNLAATRYVTESKISSSTVSQLGVAWNLPIGVSATFGALVANPVIADGILFQQDAQSNVYAVKRDTGEKV